MRRNRVVARASLLTPRTSSWPVDLVPEHAQERRDERQHRGDGGDDDEDGADADRLEGGRREDDHPAEREDDGQTGEENGLAGGAPGQFDRGQFVETVPSLLAIALDDEE